MLKKKDKYNVAVMGATGAVGTQFLWILEERGFPINEPHNLGLHLKYVLLSSA